MPQLFIARKSKRFSMNFSNDHLDFLHFAYVDIVYNNIYVNI